MEEVEGGFLESMLPSVHTLRAFSTDSLLYEIRSINNIIGMLIDILLGLSVDFLLLGRLTNLCVYLASSPPPPQKNRGTSPPCPPHTNSQTQMCVGCLRRFGKGGSTEFLKSGCGSCMSICGHWSTSKSMRRPDMQVY